MLSPAPPCLTCLYIEASKATCMQPAHQSAAPLLDPTSRLQSDMHFHLPVWAVVAPNKHIQCLQCSGACPSGTCQSVISKTQHRMPQHKQKQGGFAPLSSHPVHILWTAFRPAQWGAAPFGTHYTKQAHGHQGQHQNTVACAGQAAAEPGLLHAPGPKAVRHVRQQRHAALHSVRHGLLGPSAAAGLHYPGPRWQGDRPTSVQQVRSGPTQCEIWARKVSTVCPTCAGLLQHPPRRPMPALEAGLCLLQLV